MQFFTCIPKYIMSQLRGSYIPKYTVSHLSLYSYHHEKMKFHGGTYFPFLIRLRPSNGSSTGSTFSSMFSRRTVAPLLIDCSITSRYPRWPKRITFRESPYFCFIHLTPCSYNNIKALSTLNNEVRLSYVHSLRFCLTVNTRHLCITKMN